VVEVEVMVLSVEVVEDSLILVLLAVEVEVVHSDVYLYDVVELMVYDRCAHLETTVVDIEEVDKMEEYHKLEVLDTGSASYEEILANNVFDVDHNNSNNLGHHASISRI